MATFSEIREHVRAITHKGDNILTDALFETWQTVVLDRLNNALELRNQIVSTTVSPASNPFAVASDAIKVLELSFDYGARKVEIQPASRETVTKYLGLTGAQGPVFFNTEGTSVRVAPFTASQTLNVTYQASFAALANPGDSNVVSTSHLGLYHSAFLQLCYEYLRDFEAADRYGRLFDNEVRSINEREAWNVTTDGAVTSGAWTWA